MPDERKAGDGLRESIDYTPSPPASDHECEFGGGTLVAGFPPVGTSGRWVPKNEVRKWAQQWFYSCSDDEIENSEQ